MKTRKDWQEYKKKHKIPDGLVISVELGPALGKCADIVNNESKPTSAKLTAIVKFQKELLLYKQDLKKRDPSLVRQVTKFLDEVEEEMAKVYEEAKGDSDGKGVLVNLHPDGDVIDRSTERVLQHRKLGEDKGLRREGEEDNSDDERGFDSKKLEENADFSKSGSEPIVLLAHGRRLGEKGSAKVVASHFAKKTPSEIVAFLTKSLPLTYHGVIYLDGCYTAAGNSPMNYAKQVYDLLVKKGYMYLQVKGNLGLAVTINGKEFVTPAELEDYKRSIAEKLKELKEAEQELEKAVKQRKHLENLLASNKKMTQMAIILKSPPNKEHEEKIKEENATYLKGIELLDKQITDPKWATRKKIIQGLEDIIKQNHRIEALTGTFGPEMLPPKSK